MCIHCASHSGQIVRERALGEEKRVTNMERQGKREREREKKGRDSQEQEGELAGSRPVHSTHLLSILLRVKCDVPTVIFSKLTRGIAGTVITGK